MFALFPILLLSAQTAAPAAAEAPSGRPRIFIAPSGEPFHTYGTDPVAQWFAGADKNGDGKLDLAEFTADFLRFFDQLDVNHDGAIDGIERTRYENQVAPETLGGSFIEEVQQDDGDQGGAGVDGFGGDDSGASTVSKPKPLYGSNPTGAARFDLLGLPEPVAAMDTELRGRITRKMATEAAQLRFNVLDSLHRGYLTLDELPATYAESHRAMHLGGSRRRGGRRR